MGVGVDEDGNPFAILDDAPPVLYRSWSGFEVKNFSYSLSKDIGTCGEYVKLTRFQGLAEKVDSAALHFGICCEDSLVNYLTTKQDPVKEFAARWKQFEKMPMKFAKNDKNWTNLNYVGKALMDEFLSTEEHIGLENPEFGVHIPRDPAQLWYNGTRLEYIADCISHPHDGDVLIDIKTSGRAYPDGEEKVGYPALDPQLLTGSLVSGIRKVAFIVLVKTANARIQYHTGHIRDYVLERHNEWLKEQYHKLIERRLPMRTGVRFPDDHCMMCSCLPVCLGNDKLAAETLRQKSSDEVEAQFSELDEI